MNFEQNPLRRYHIASHHRLRTFLNYVKFPPSIFYRNTTIAKLSHKTKSSHDKPIFYWVFNTIFTLKYQKFISTIAYIRPNNLLILKTTIIPKILLHLITNIHILPRRALAHKHAQYILDQGENKKSCWRREGAGEGGSI